MDLIKQLFTTFVLLGLLAPAPRLLAQPIKSDENAQLRAQIQALSERIAELERKVAEPARSLVQPSLINGWDPFAEMESLQAEMNRMFRDSYGRSSAIARSAFNPAADIKTSADHYTITIDVPGMEKGDINVEVKDGLLIVSGERSGKSEKSKDGQYFRQERTFGKFYRTMSLPEDVKSDEVKADYKNGVLEITLKRDSQKVPASRKINVN